MLGRESRRILGRELTDPETGRFSKYLELLVNWQRVHRLVGSGAPDWIVEHVFLDSLLFHRLLPASARDVLDAGSGAGVPGIPLKLVNPALGLTMVETRQRRVSFLSTAIRELMLADTRVVDRRLEEVIRESAGQYDAVVARCAGDLGYVFGLGAHLVRPGGLVIASGPPREHPLPVGRWVTVPGVRAGQTRRFAVYERV